MDFPKAIILAIVEGLTEFLPISSTGHLVLTSRFLNIPQTEFVKSFEIIIQLGAVFAILFLYWRTILTNKKIWKIILMAFIPTAIVGFIFYKTVKVFLLGNPLITLLALFVGGILLIVLEKLYKEKEHHTGSLEKISFKNAFLVGIFQSISIIPGVSRSGATIIPALLLGIKRKTAVEFSFLLAIPTMFAATTLDIFKSQFSFTPPELSILITGFIGSFLVAILAVKFLLKFVQNHTFIPFGIYRIVLAIAFALFVLR